MDRVRIINESKHLHGADANIRSRAKDLRKNMTIYEKLIWERLRKRQIKGKYFRRQHPYGIYILDFFCFESNLVIEIDGEIHKKQKESDKERTEYLKNTGLTELRFTNKEIKTNIDRVISIISDYL